MATAQSSLKGVTRGIEYAKSILDSNSSFYAKGEASMEELRDRAIELAYLADKALERNGLGDKEGLDAELASLKTVKKARKRPVQPKKTEDFEGPLRPIHSPFEELKSKRVRVPKYYARRFKITLKEVASLPMSSFSSPLVRAIAITAQSYFTIRFDGRNDPNQVHKFDQRQFKTYLACLVLAFASAKIHNNLNEFHKEITSYLEDVKKGHNPFTLPKTPGMMFFRMIHVKDGTPKEPMPEDVFLLARQWWEELWDLGYSEFADYKESYSPIFPDREMVWIEESCDILHIKYERENDLITQSFEVDEPQTLDQVLTQLENAPEPEIERDVEILRNKQECLDIVEKVCLEESEAVFEELNIDSATKEDVRDALTLQLYKTLTMLPDTKVRETFDVLRNNYPELEFNIYNPNFDWKFRRMVRALTYKGVRNKLAKGLESVFMDQEIYDDLRALRSDIHILALQCGEEHIPSLVSWFNDSKYFNSLTKMSQYIKEYEEKVYELHGYRTTVDRGRKIY